MPFFITLICFLAVVFLLILSGRGGKKRFEGIIGFDIAHRGLHNKPTVPENSMPAFKAAVEKGYGIELDLHLLSDGGLAVFHDNTLDRTAGVSGNVKDLTLDTLKDYKLEGTEYHIPSFKEVLELVDGKVPLIIELKTEGNTAKLCKATMDALKDYKGYYCIESFDPRVLMWLHRHRPDVTRGQLSQNFIKSKSGQPLPLRILLTALMFNFLTQPDFIAYRFSDRKLIFNQICLKFWALQPVCWTIKNNEDHKTAKKEGYITIFEQFEMEQE